MVSQGFSLGTPRCRPNAILQFLILGTQNLFEAVRLTVPKARVLLVSSSEIYGAGRGVVDVIHRETDPPSPSPPMPRPWPPANCWPGSTLSAHNLDIVTVRPFSSTGPYQDEKFVLPSVAAQIATIEMYDGETAIYTGNLDVSRDYLDVRDQARAIAMLAKRGGDRRSLQRLLGQGPHHPGPGPLPDRPVAAAPSRPASTPPWSAPSTSPCWWARRRRS